MKPKTDDELISAAESSFKTPFSGVIRLEPDGAAAVWVDGRKAPKISADKPKAAPAEDGFCVWRASRDTLMRILGGERLLGSSYVSGRLAISGDISVMSRLVLERPARA